MWDHILNELIKDNQNLHIALQYPFWYKSKELTREESSNPSSVRSISSSLTPSVAESRHPTPLHVLPELQMSKRQTRASRKARLASAGITSKDLATAGWQHQYTEGSTQAKIPANGDETSTSLRTNSVAESDFLRDFLLSNVKPRGSSSSGSAVTEHVVDAHTCIPDFAVLHTDTILDEVNIPSKRFRVRMLRILMIVEIKLYIGRDLTGQKKTLKIQSAIHTATTQVLEQAGALFLNYPDANLVIGIAVCGPYWSYANIRPNDMPSYVWKRLNASSDYPYIPSTDSTPSSGLLDLN
ncbi:hypothetical protein Clacol_000327 [Clathrus columnatus]|uniref:Uncharacterized protein n=1 Tax=Clathrus columnatus TaxID=1419009 RepID=A0AAV4ZYA4_9AGAM|nr:hypothetical protein Clacol_000327 [Clathrus columnatus]